MPGLHLFESCLFGSVSSPDLLILPQLTSGSATVLLSIFQEDDFLFFFFLLLFLLLISFSFSSFLILPLLFLECKPPPWSTGAQGPGSWPFYLPWRPKELLQVFCLPPVLYINKPPAPLRLHRLLENISFMV